MSDRLGILLTLLAMFVPLLLAWWLVARGVSGRSRRRGKMPPDQGG